MKIHFFPVAFCGVVLLSGCQTPVDTRTYYLSDLERRQARDADQVPRHAFVKVKSRAVSVRVAQPVTAPSATPAGPDDPYYAKRPYHRPPSTFPVAKKAHEKGYVVSPYTKAKINVQHIPPGARVVDPVANQVFINP